MSRSAIKRRGRNEFVVSDPLICLLNRGQEVGAEFLVGSLHPCGISILPESLGSNDGFPQAKNGPKVVIINVAVRADGLSFSSRDQPEIIGFLAMLIDDLGLLGDVLDPKSSLPNGSHKQCGANLCRRSPGSG